METETGRLEHQGQLQLTLPSPGIPGLDVVRALHQTVISLRSALDASREELRKLKESVGEYSGENYVDVVERLSLENHVLRRRIIQTNKEIINNVRNPDRTISQSSGVKAEDSSKPTERLNDSRKMEESRKEESPETKPTINIPNSDDDDDFVQPRQEEPEIPPKPKDEQVEHLDVPEKDLEDLSLKSISDGDNSVFSDNPDPQHQQQEQEQQQDSKPTESENESEELDDIELIFTTDETCRDVGLQEDLVSITENESWQQQSSTEQPILMKYMKGAGSNNNSGESNEGFICNGDKTSSVEEAVSSQSSSIDREESVDRFDESSSTRLNKMWSQCSVLVETDISKCGVVEESAEHSARHAARRNTLAAPPTAYRPIIHREALAGGRRKSAAPLRPVMDKSYGARRESGAQTDISALPAQWRSESYLAHKVAHTFTTLPSKFALPTGIPGRLRLSDKTRESRRVMLSDISFTSMVPELSRSADHLCHDTHAQTCFATRGCGLRTPEVYRRESLGSPAGYWPRCHQNTGLPSPCDCRLSTDLYASKYRGSLTSIVTPTLEIVNGPPRRHSWRATAASFDTWRAPIYPTSTSRPTWSSMPSSPTHIHPPSTNTSKLTKNFPKRTRSKVTFQECPMIRGSLPNLRSDVVGDNSGDSTESLIDEAEDYLRRSIDSMLTISNSDNWNRQQFVRRKRTRRHSEPDLFREWNPPKDARPYLPKIPRDLKLDYLVKVISPEGRVLQGRVRYVGPVPGREDAHVGVELPNDNGTSDGTFHGRRFFDCDPDRAVFVPFKKVVLAWCTST